MEAGGIGIVKAFQTMAILAFFTVSDAAGQIWFAKTVSNLDQDEARRFYNLGDHCGIYVGEPPKGGNAYKIDDWNDASHYYVLYPLFDVSADSAPIAGSPGENGTTDSTRTAGTAPSPAPGDTALQGEEKHVCNDVDGIGAYGKAVFHFKGKIVLKTRNPLNHEEFKGCYDLSEIVKVP
ncbi:MAG: hypothetical protein JXA71_16510 [Chitinispirillaceae bacterium]|nr:hypothetical protein [Chitinispirillaceae bacterium]